MSEPLMQDTAIGPLPADWSVVKLRTVSSEGTVRNRNLDFGRADVLGVDNQTGLGPSDRLLGDDFSRYKLVRKDQFAYNPMRLNVGSIGLWCKDKTGIVSPDYIVFGCHEDRLDPDFLDLFRDSTSWELQIRQSGQGSVRIRYYYRHIAEFYIPLPPLREQHAIAHVLRTVQQAKEATEKVIAGARQLKQSLMRHLFTYGPVPFDQTDRVALKETEIGMVPEHWRLAKLGDLVSMATGGTPSRDVLEYWNGGIPWVKTGEVNYNLIRSTQETISQAGLDNSNAHLFPSGTLLVAMYGQGVTRGRVAFLGIEATTNQACAALFPSEDLDKDFLYHTFVYNYERIRDMGHGAHQRNLSMAMLRTVDVHIPPLEEQVQIAQQIGPVDNKLEAEESRVRASDDLFRTLLHNLMTGKVRVHDVPTFAKAGGSNGHRQ